MQKSLSSLGSDDATPAWQAPATRDVGRSCQWPKKACEMKNCSKQINPHHDSEMKEAKPAVC